MATSTFTSKYFEDNVALLRNEVSRYLERGICVVDHSFKGESSLSNPVFVYNLCKELSKARGNPFVSVEFMRTNGRDRLAIARMPMTPRVKCLSAQAMMIGHQLIDGTSCWQHTVSFIKKNGLTVYYQGEMGHEALMAWLHSCEHDKAMRFALGLPTIVTRQPVTS